MRLAHRVLLVLSVTMAVLFLGNAALLHGVVSREFQQLETSAALRNAQRALHGIMANLAQLQGSAMDWGLWDSAHAFMQGHDRAAFISENLVFQSFQGIGADLMYFIGPDGRVIWGGQYKLDSGERQTTPAPLVRALLHVACGQEHCAPRSARSGFVKAGEEVWLVAAAPILHADGSGPAAGTLIVGRLLTPALMEAVQKQVQVTFSLSPRQHSPADPMPPDRLETSRFQVRSGGSGHLLVRTTLPDLQGQPLLVLEAQLDRSISRSGTAMANYGLALSALMLAAAGGLTLWMLRQQVLHPVASLLARVQRARAAPPCKPSGGDELQVLSAEFDATFRQLEETRRQLAEQSFYTGMAELAGGMTHNVRNTLTPVSVRLWRLQAQAEDGLLDRLQAAAAMLSDPEHNPRAAMAAKYLQAGLAEAARRAAALTDDIQLMSGQIDQVERILADHQAFTRSGRTLEAVDVAVAITSAARLLGSSGIAILVCRGLEALPPVSGHTVILAQIFGNLLVNAEEAILAAGHGKGTITVTGGLITATDHSLVEITIADNGQGIAMELLDRLFERGFSTKRASTGGIGLHWCANTLASLGGSIAVSSAGPGCGATVTVRLRPFSEPGEARKV